MDNAREYVTDLALNDELLFADGLDEALIGYVEICGQNTVALYDRDKCIRILMRDGMDYEDATEYFEFNTAGAYVGEYTPAFATLFKSEVQHGETAVVGENSEE